jgi:hypothetical protein
MKKHLYIDKSNIHGKGLRIAVSIPANTKILLVADMEKWADVNRMEMGLSWITRLAGYLNHQSNANTFLKQNDIYYYLYSNRFIHAGEELTIDYTILPVYFSKEVKGYKEL